MPRNCEWQAEDCKFFNSDKCDTCFTYKQNYKAVEPVKFKTMSRKQQKEDKRQGSAFEFKNHKTNVEILQDKVVSGMTLNSGATVLEKGDEQIRGIINIMEELKTKTSQKSSGTKNFTIKKEWLDKLHREAIKEDKEFWYLKFSFLEADKDVYVITEQEIIMAMVKTMVEDRLRVKKFEKFIDAMKAKCNYLEQKNLALESQLKFFQAVESFLSDEIKL